MYKRPNEAMCAKTGQSYFGWKWVDCSHLFCGLSSIHIYFWFNAQDISFLFYMAFYKSTQWVPLYREQKTSFTLFYQKEGWPVFAHIASNAKCEVSHRRNALKGTLKLKHVINILKISSSIHKTEILGTLILFHYLISKMCISEDILSKQLIGFALDGAAYLHGIYGGAATYICDKFNPNIVVILVWIKKLQLAVYNVIDTMSVLLHFKSFVDTLYSHFSASPKYQCELTEIAKHWDLNLKK